jgi:hypothetical protein
MRDASPWRLRRDFYLRFFAGHFFFGLLVVVVGAAALGADGGVAVVPGAALDTGATLDAAAVGLDAAEARRRLGGRHGRLYRRLAPPSTKT